jgi:hypothetical protein
VHALCFALLLAFAGVTVSCYRQPEIPRDRPLSCSSSDPGDCPPGFSCLENRICAPEECELAEDCPIGLVCGRNGCALPGSIDGSDGSAEVGGDAGSDAASNLDGPAGPDAPATPDVPFSPDAPASLDLGGGS